MSYRIVAIALAGLAAGALACSPQTDLPTDTELAPSFIKVGDETGGRPLTAHLTGAAEVPGPGDPDGSGHAIISLNQGQGEVCWHLQVADIAAATAAHIHVGAAGVAGGVVVPLSAPSSGEATGCRSADPALIKAIRQNPGNYYVNVHNAAFPPGALRGQLGK